MSPTQGSPERPFDWQEMRASILRRMAHHLRGWTAEEIEDATQDVAHKLLLFLERAGRVESPDGLATVIARRTAADRIRARTRRPAPERLTEESAMTVDEATRRELVELEQLVEWRAFQVIAFFRNGRSPCLELAEARARGVAFKRLAGDTGQSHAALLQRWSRCMRRLRDAISAGEVPWDGPEVGT